VTAGACRRACLLGVQQSFAKAGVALAEVAGWDLDDHTVRRLCHAAAARAAAGRAERSTAEALARAEGDREVHIDAGEANTLQGWRDVQVAVCARRPRGEPSTAAGRDERDLPRRRGAPWRPPWRRPAPSATAAPRRPSGWG
jgi:hypothetical protein